MLVCEAEWKDTIFELNVDQMINELEDANKKMDAIQKSVLNWKPGADFLNNYN
jgi:hypothetical protein